MVHRRQSGGIGTDTQIGLKNLERKAPGGKVSLPGNSALPDGLMKINCTISQHVKISKMSIREVFICKIAKGHLL